MEKRKEIRIDFLLIRFSRFFLLPILCYFLLYFLLYFLRYFLLFFLRLAAGALNLKALRASLPILAKGSAD